MATVTFKRATDRRWLGNGFGYVPCSYAILRDGVEVGAISYGNGDYRVYETGNPIPLRSLITRLADAKDDARRRFGGTA